MRTPLAVLTILLPGVLVAAAAQAQTTPPPTLALPAVHAIVSTRDTVTFCATVGADRMPAHYLWLRGPRQWRRVWGQPGAGCPSPRVDAPAVDEDSITLAPRLSLVRIVPRKGGTRTHLMLHDGESGRTLIIRPNFAESTIDRLLASRPPADSGALRISGDTLGSRASAWVANDSLVWVALAGPGARDSAFALGGLVRVDRRTGTVDLLLGERLADTRVIAMRQTGPWLWLGTAREGTTSGAGVLRLDTRTRDWEEYTARNGVLPDAQVITLTTDAATLAVATRSGLAVADLRGPAEVSAVGSGRPGEDEAIAAWHVASYAATFAGDTLVFEPGPRGAPISGAAAAAYTILQRYSRRGEERLLYRAIVRLEGDRLARAAYASADSAADALAEPSLAPMLIRMLAHPGEGREVAALALGALGARAPRNAPGAVRGVFMAADSSSDIAERARSRYARALTRLGDSTGVRWARGVLEAQLRGRRTSLAPARTAAAAPVVAEAGDRAGLSLVIGLAAAAPPGAEPAIVNALATYDQPAAWGSLVAFARSGKLPAVLTLDALTPAAMRDAAVARAVREWLAQLTESGDAGVRAAAVRAGKRLGTDN